MVYKICMRDYTRIKPADLGPEHIGRTVYIKYPKGYMRKFNIGIIEAILADEFSIVVRLRGGIEGAKILKDTDESQEEIWLTP